MRAVGVSRCRRWCGLTCGAVLLGRFTVVIVPVWRAFWPVWAGLLRVFVGRALTFEQWVELRRLEEAFLVDHEKTWPDDEPWVKPVEVVPAAAAPSAVRSSSGLDGEVYRHGRSWGCECYLCGMIVHSLGKKLEAESLLKSHFLVMHVPLVACDEEAS